MENILIIDSHADFRETLMTSLKQKGYAVFGAGNTLEALEVLKKASFALVISEVQLPNVDGIDIFARILSVEENTGVKTMLITGDLDRNLPVQAIKLGVNDFLYKPFKMEAFLSSVDRLMKSFRFEDGVELHKKLSILDGLTNIFNHRYFHEIIMRELNRAERYRNSLTLFMIDIDNFKQFNDAHGHLAGDEALKKIAYILEGTLRNVDLIFRYGGKKFSILMPEIEGDNAFVAATRIVKSVASQYFNDDMANPARLTVSIGCASFPKNARTKVEFIKKADQALLQAKRYGKNMVCSAG